MPLTASDIIAIRAAVQAELEEYGARLWGPTGTAGSFAVKATARQKDIQETVNRIEADTSGDDTFPPPPPPPPKA